nr:MAG TPA: hypothetical protein [Caudoviricetes sp.]
MCVRVMCVMRRWVRFLILWIRCRGQGVRGG